MPEVLEQMNFISWIHQEMQMRVNTQNADKMLMVMLMMRD